MTPRMTRRSGARQAAGLHAVGPELARGRLAFTLIELLTVIAIILILAALLLPAINALMRQAQRSKTASQVVAIANAIQAYRNTYSRWPGQDQGASDNVADPELIVRDLVDNPRNIPFLDLKPAWTNVYGYFVDPWEQEIEIAMDENEDGDVSVVSWSCAEVTGVNMSTNVEGRTVLVMSWGPDPANRDKWVLSWRR
jgi:prepilin-type N-terminal cleavage/methylation domain-containing protein